MLYGWCLSVIFTFMLEFHDPGQPASHLRAFGCSSIRWGWYTYFKVCGLGKNDTRRASSILQTNKPGHRQVGNRPLYNPWPLPRALTMERGIPNLVVEQSLPVDCFPSERNPVLLLKSHSKCLAGLCPHALFPAYEQVFFFFSLSMNSFNIWSK